MGKEAMLDSKNAITVSVITILSKNQTQKSKKFEKQTKKNLTIVIPMPVYRVGRSLDPVCPRPVPSLRQPLDLGLALPRPLDLDLCQGSL